MMFIYLPMTFGDEFRQYVGPILPTVLKVLSSTNKQTTHSYVMQCVLQNIPELII